MWLSSVFVMSGPVFCGSTQFQCKAAGLWPFVDDVSSCFVRLSVLLLTNLTCPSLQSSGDEVPLASSHRQFEFNIETKFGREELWHLSRAVCGCVWCLMQFGVCACVRVCVLRGYFAITGAGLARTRSCVVILVNVFSSILLQWD